MALQQRTADGRRLAQHGGIAVVSELDRSELLSDRGVVVDLTVEHSGAPGRVDHWLMPAARIHDRQAGVPERAASGRVDPSPTAVGSPVPQRFEAGFNDGGIDGRVEREEHQDATHGLSEVLSVDSEEELSGLVVPGLVEDALVVIEREHLSEEG